MTLPFGDSDRHQEGVCVLAIWLRGRSSGPFSSSSLSAVIFRLMATRVRRILFC